LENFGVEYPSQNEEVKEKSRKTCLENFGVEHPSQNEEVHYKQQTSSFRYKDYLLPSGNIVKIQGF